MPQTSFPQSEITHEILSRPPHGLLRYGISLMAILLFLVLLGAHFVQYPDTVSAKVIITTLDAPAPLVARSSGKIQHWFASDQRNVEQGTVLAVLENTADYETVQKIHAQLISCQNQISEFPIFSENMVLGELSNPFQNLQKALQEYQTFKNLAYHQQKIQAIESQIIHYEQLNQNLLSQKTILEQDLALTKRKVRIDSTLEKSKTIALIEYDQTQSQFLQKQNSQIQHRSSLISNNLRLAELRQQIIETLQDEQNQTQRYQIAIEQAYSELQSRIAQYEQQYVLRSPITGKISLYGFWNINQSVKAGDQVLAVVPSKTQMLCRAELPVAGSGKVKVGQKAYFKLDNFPFAEYGTVDAVVQSISLLPQSEKYQLVFSLPKGLRTAYHDSLVFEAELQGTAEIMTEEISLFERIFYQMRKLLKK